MCNLINTHTHTLISEKFSRRRHFTVHTGRVEFFAMGFSQNRCLLYVVVYRKVVVFLTLTDRASTIPSNIRGCQSGTWSQGGTKINGSHHGDNPLLRPTGIHIATKWLRLYNSNGTEHIKTVHQTSSLHIESSLDRLGLLSPTHDQRSQQQTGQIALQPVLINKSKFLKATHRTKIRKFEMPWSMVVEALSW